MTTEQRNDALEVAELTNFIGATLALSPCKIYTEKRTVEYADARALCQYILRERGWTFQRIACIYSLQSHASVMHNTKRVGRMIKIANAAELGLKLTAKKTTNEHKSNIPT